MNKVEPLEIEHEKTEAIEKKPSFIFSVRFLLSFVLFLGIIVQFMQRSNMGIAIVCMVSQRNSSVEQLEDGKFDWSKSTRGFVLSSYFYGYIITQIPSGMLSIKYGPKIVLLIGVFGGSIGTIIAAPVAKVSVYLLMFVRFLTGVFHGLAFPTTSSFFVRWAPPDEKSRLIAFSSAGTNIGNVISLLVGGVLCESEFYYGWGSIFIIFGSIGFVWLLLLIFLTSSSPTEHRFISQNEKMFIVNSIPNFHHIKKKRKTPWLNLFKSRASIAIFCAHFGFNWGTYLFLTQMPTYISDVLKFDIRSNGLFSSLPYISAWIVTNASGFVADKIIKTNRISKTMVRRIFNSLGLYGQMCAVIALTFITSSQPYMGVVLLTVAIGCNGFVLGAGYLINVNEIGGKYAGILYSISNTFATIPGIVAPYVVGLLTPNSKQEEWRVVFIISAVVYFISGTIYVIFCSSEQQNFGASTEDNENENENENKP